MRDVVVIVEAQGRLVVFDRFIVVAVFEEQIADIRDRGNVTRVEFERRDEVRQRIVTIAEADVDDAALIKRGDTFVSLDRRFHGRREKHECLGEVPALERDCSLGIGRSHGRTTGGNPAHEVEERHIAMLSIDVITLFPEMFAPVIGLSIVGRAIERGLVDVRMHPIIDVLPQGERADDRPFGGGPGMVLRIEPLANIIDAIIAVAPADERRRIVLTAAAGTPFVHADAVAFGALDRLILICGHYEGVDERLGALYPVESYSLGEFVLTGGEIPAMAFLDAAVRLIPGVIAADSAAEESFASGGLDHPAFTRPPRFRGIDVPPVLLSGDHKAIAAWRREQSRMRASKRNAT